MKKQTEKCKDFKVGDVVQLKSGGPRMTVSFDAGKGTVHVIWFDNDEKVQGEEFLKSILKLA